MKRYAAIHRQLDKLGSAEGVFEVDFVDGTRKRMSGLEMVLYTLHVAAYEGTDESEQYPDIAKYTLLYGDGDLTPTMQNIIDAGIEDGKTKIKNRKENKE